jgi:hypothetical protein
MGQFHRGVVTTYALKVGVAADRDDRDQSLSAFLAERYFIHEMLPENPEHEPLFRALRPNGRLILLVRMHPDARRHRNGPQRMGRYEPSNARGRGVS